MIVHLIVKRKKYRSSDRSIPGEDKQKRGSFSRAMVSVIGFIVLLLSAWFVSISCETALASETIVAKVGSVEISEAYLEEMLLKYVPPGGFHTGVDRSQKEEYRKSALSDIIEIELLYHEARARGMDVSDEVMKKIININIEGLGSEDAFKAALEQRGMSLDEFKERIKKHQMVNDLLMNLMNESVVDDEELKEIYGKHKTSYKRPEALYLYHILIKVEPNAPEDTWQERMAFANQLLEKIRSGEDFGSIAYQYSEDPYKFKNGEIGYVHRGRLTPKELEDAAFSLKKGEMSDVIRTIHGFHILKAGDRKPAEIKSFDEVKDTLKRDQEKKRFEEKKSSILDRLRKEYPVEKYGEFANKP
jgi:parvulin-like peptidyl-prolyl isomerase